METKNHFSQTVMYFAIIYAALAIIFMVFQPKTMAPNTTTAIMGFVSLLLFISIPIVAVKTLKKHIDEIKLGKSIKLGILIGLLGGLLAGIYAFVYYKYFNPEQVTQMLEISRETLEKTGSFSEEQINQQMDITEKYFFELQIIGQLFTGALYGLIGGLIGGLFYKSKNYDY